MSKIRTSIVYHKGYGHKASVSRSRGTWSSQVDGGVAQSSTGCSAISGIFREPKIRSASEDRRRRHAPKRFKHPDELPADECQDIRIDCVRMGCEHSVRKAGIDLQRAMLD